MGKKVLLTATVQSHICQFHKPLANMLQENGYEVHVAARDNLAEKNGLQMEYADKVFDINFDRSPLNFKNNFNAYKELSKVLSKNEYEIIHANTPVGGIITRIAANKYRKKCNTKVFYTAHGFHFYKGASRKNWLIYYPIEKFMSRFTDKLITITDEDFKFAQKKFHCRIVHIHGVGANSDKFYPLNDTERAAVRNEFGYSKDLKIILNVGELLSNKNQRTAILAMKYIIKEYSNCKLLIAGNGEELHNLQTIVTQNNLDNHVEFLGYTTEINKYMNIADCVVACSFREGLPLNVMEAMLCGKAVVASNNRGHRELVQDGKTGYIVEADNIQDFADKIKLVLSDEKMYNDAAMAAVALFTKDSVLRELKGVYFSE